MNCPNCGAPNQSGRFCMRCRKPLAVGAAAAPTARRPPGTAPRPRPAGAAAAKRPVVVERLSTLMLLQAAFAAAYAIFLPRGVIFALMGVVALVSLAAAIGLRQLLPWGRLLAIAYAVVTLLAIPVGPVFGGFLLVYLFKPEVKAAFSSDPSTRHLAAQAADLWRPLSVVIGVLNILLVLALVGTAAAVLVPQFVAG